MWGELCRAKGKAAGRGIVVWHGSASPAAPGAVSRAPRQGGRWMGDGVAEPEQLAARAWGQRVLAAPVLLGGTDKLPARPEPAGHGVGALLLYKVL